MDDSHINFYFSSSKDSRTTYVPAGLNHFTSVSYIRNTNIGSFEIKTSPPECYVDIRQDQSLLPCECCAGVEKFENPFISADVIDKEYVLPMNSQDLTALKNETTKLTFFDITLTCMGSTTYVASGESFKCEVTSNSNFFKFKHNKSSSSIVINSDNSKITLSGTVSQINELIEDILYITTANGVSKAVSIESDDNTIGELDKIKFDLSVTKNSTTYHCISTVTFILDSFKHSEFVVPEASSFSIYINQINNVSFSNKLYTNQEIVDAEKTPPGSDGLSSNDNPADWRTMDDSLCWAGSSSNMLEFCRWGRQQLSLPKNTLDREDKYFRYFIDRSKVDQGYWIDYGLLWFLSGSFTYQYSGHWEPKSGATGINIMSKAEANKYIHNWNISDSEYNKGPSYIVTTYYQIIERALRNGCGVGFGIFSSVGGLAHAVTCIGILYSTANPSRSDPNHYQGLLITDSDNHHPVNNPPDTVTVAQLKGSSSWPYLLLDDLYKGSSYKNIIIKQLTILDRNNGHPNEYFYDHGDLIDVGSSRQLRNCDIGYLTMMDEMVNESDLDRSEPLS